MLIGYDVTVHVTLFLIHLVNRNGFLSRGAWHFESGRVAAMLCMDTRHG